MASINTVIIAGNLTKNPESKQTPSGTAICKLDLAINEKRKSGDEWVDETTYVNNITVFGRQAENCAEYLSKGSPVLIEGRLKYNTWEDKDTGKTRGRLEVTAYKVQFLSTKRDREEQGEEETSESSYEKDDNVPF